MTFDVAFIGTGPKPDDPGPDGYGMAYRHATGYQRLDDCELVACADIERSNAESFAKAFDLDHVFEDQTAMCRELEPDIVSVCVPPAAHASVVTACARTGMVDAIHCEKPMAITWKDCEEMVSVCGDWDVQLTINHQRRFGLPFQLAKSHLDDGVIGDLRRIEVAEVNLFDAGSHLFDLCGFYTEQATPEWVLAQIDYTTENRWFGAHNENQAIAQWRYEDGTYGLASTGPGQPFVDCYLRLIGIDGVLEIGVEDGPALRLRNEANPAGSVIDTDGEDIHGPPSPSLVSAATDRLSARIPGISASAKRPSYIERAIESVVEALRSGSRPDLSAEHALQSTEIIFASWESARRRGRVDLPLEIDDNPLEALVEAGQLPVSEEIKP